MRSLAAGLAALALLAGACGPGQAGADQPLVIGGIPDQDLSVLQERFGGLADHLSEQLGVPVEYRSSTSYAALVTAFRNGDIQLGWFGGLTGVQARLGVEGAHAIAQRPRDTEFRSVFIAGPGVEANSLADLAGLSFTFGSESSTSGHLMPRHFLLEFGVDPERDFDGRPNFSGSHDKTWKLVESGTYQAGALNAAVWDRAVEGGQVDTSKVTVVQRTEPYYDYHFVVHPAVNQRYGQATAEQIEQALLSMHEGSGARASRVLDLFQTDRFVPTGDANYATIAEVARRLGLIGR